jgi:tRNA pseudouridine55 synthase
MIMGKPQMKLFILVWKSIGQTPLEKMRLSQQERGLEDQKAVYAGRLDPMACGVSLLLVGDKEHVGQMMTYCREDKTYRFQAILGYRTDSYDAMGNIVSAKMVIDPDPFIRKMLEKTTIMQKFPPCSAYRYKGKAMWKHKLEGTLPSDEDWPQTQRVIHNVKLLQKPVIIDNCRFLSELCHDLDDISENAFGGHILKEHWCQRGNNDYVWRLVFEAKVSSGTFIRGLVHDIGVETNTPALAFRITRIN